MLIRHHRSACGTDDRAGHAVRCLSLDHLLRRHLAHFERRPKREVLVPHVAEYGRDHDRDELGSGRVQSQTPDACPQDDRRYPLRRKIHEVRADDLVAELPREMRHWYESDTGEIECAAEDGWLAWFSSYREFIGHLIDGQIDYLQSMGLLTTGIYVPFAMVLPYIIAFYLVLAIFEDSGYLPRLATLTDTIFHRFGMHGFGIIPVFLGLGCNVPGVLATGTLETKKQRFIAATLLAISVPCMAKNAMVIGILGPYGVGYIILVFATLFIVFVVSGLVLNRLIRGDSPEICLEIPPYRKPDVATVLKKTWMRVLWFLKEAIPFLFLGVLLINLLYAVGFVEWLGVLFAPVIQGWFGLPKEAAPALLIGFLRKDLAVGMLLPLGMSPLQLVIATTAAGPAAACSDTPGFASAAIVQWKSGPTGTTRMSATPTPTARNQPAHARRPGARTLPPTGKRRSRSSVEKAPIFA